MASAFIATVRAAVCAGAVVLAPQAALADLGAVDLSEVRRVLSALEADVTRGLDRPADVDAIWSTMPFGGIVGTWTAGQIAMQQSPTPSTTFGAIFPAPSLNSVPSLNSASALSGPMPARVDAVPARIGDDTQSGSGLFALEMSRSAREIAPAPVIAPLPAPIFGASSAFGINASPTQATDTARTPPQDVGSANFRMMLSSLSQTYTGRNSMAVVNAQGPRGPIAVSVRAGTVTLDDIRSYAAALGLPPRLDGTMTAPVIVWPGATLRLSPGENLMLARDSGAFILSMGTLDIDGATIEAVGRENPYTPSFVPFVTIADGGSLLMQGATMRGLGFGQTAKFNGLSVASNLLTRSGGKIVIRDSLFDGLQNVTISGVSGAEITGNTFINARDNTLQLTNAPRGLIQNNLFTGGSHTNAIRVEQGSVETTIKHNIFIRGHRVAVLVTGGSDRVQVNDNLVWKREGAGVKFLNANCGLAQGNVVLDNRQKGIEVRKSDGAVVRDNLIAGNGSSGIWVSAQKHDALASVSGNILVANGSGLSAATGAGILLHGNDFSGQLPRLLDGDIARLTRAVVQDLHGEAVLKINAGSVQELSETTPLCGGNL